MPHGCILRREMIDILDDGSFLVLGESHYHTISKIRKFARNRDKQCMLWMDPTNNGKIILFMTLKDETLGYKADSICHRGKNELMKPYRRTFVFTKSTNAMKPYLDWAIVHMHKFYSPTSRWGRLLGDLSSRYLEMWLNLRCRYAFFSMLSTMHFLFFCIFFGSLFLLFH